MKERKTCVLYSTSIEGKVLVGIFKGEYEARWYVKNILNKYWKDQTYSHHVEYTLRFKIPDKELHPRKYLFE